MRVGRKMTFRRDERGAIAAIVALSMTALLGMTVLVVDVGSLMNLRREMVRSADAAALAGAQECALNRPGSAAARANALAEANRADVNQLVVPTCTYFGTTRGRGEIKVAYDRSEDLFFAPILGLSETETIPGRATAIWGPVGSSVPVVPLVSAEGTFQGECSLPAENMAPGTLCPMWYEQPAGGGTDSSSTFGWINIESLRRDIASDGGGCQGSQSETPPHAIDNLLNNPVSDLPTLKWPLATFGCADTGAGPQQWNTLKTLADNKVTVGFPVYDAGQQATSGTWAHSLGGTGLHGSARLPSGNIIAYDVIGYAMLQLEALYDGNDPLAVGTPGTPGQAAQQGRCQTNPTTWQPNQTRALSSFQGAGCPGGSQLDEVTPGDPFVFELRPNGSRNPYPKCTPAANRDCYVYDDVDFTLQWGSDRERQVGVDFEWRKNAIAPTPGTPGACTHLITQPNPQMQDKCLVAKWVGLSTKPEAEPGTGADFGIRTFRLSE